MDGCLPNHPMHTISLSYLWYRYTGKYEYIEDFEVVHCLGLYSDRQNLTWRAIDLQLQVYSKRTRDHWQNDPDPEQHEGC